jgi:hypothetical protein
MRAVLLLPVLVSIAACGSQSPSEPPSDPSVGRVVLARVGSDARPAEVRPERNATPCKLATLTRNAISAGEPFLVDVPPTADRLAFSLACAHGPEEPRCPPFRIEGSDAEGGFRQLFQESGDVGWQDREIALDPAPERLRFSLAEGDVDGDPLWGSVLLLAPEPRLRPNVVLISMDTLGADSLEPPDGPPGVSPILGALRVRGADFRRAYAQYGNTLVSHASLFSGLYPRSHGLYSGNQPQLLTSSLVSVLADAGYRTVAFTEGAFVSAAFGFSVGVILAGTNEADEAPEDDPRAIGRRKSNPRSLLCPHEGRSEN